MGIIINTVSMLCCVFVSIFVLYLLYWVFNPYFVWKKSKSKGHVGYRIFENYKDISEQTELFLFKNINIYELTVVIPCFNEENRLPLMLDDTIKFFNDMKNKDKNFNYEIIVIDDGSKDKTAKVAQAIGQKYNCQLRVLQFIQNQGKGAAVKWGSFFARGKYILMADGDNATCIEDYNNMETSIKSIIKNGDAIVCGSRNHLKEGTVAERKLHRKFLNMVMHILVNKICGVTIKDTQCGFKLFSKKSAGKVFKVQHLHRWAFDVELLFLAYKFNIPTSEVAVNWKEIAFGNLNIVTDSIQIARDLFLIRLFYLLNLWKTTDENIY